MKYVLPALGIILIIFFGFFHMSRAELTRTENNQTTSDANVRYVPIGDSYTIGVGVPREQIFPVLLTKHLQDEGVDIELVSNPAVSGYTVDDAITYELPVLGKANANFITVLIGANDILASPPEEFSSDYAKLLDGIESQAPESKVVLLSLPDFSFTPHIQSFGYTEDQVREAILAYNKVIKEHSTKRNLPMVDLYTTTNRLGYDPELFIADEFHPSGKQFVIWEEEIFKTAQEVLQ